MNHIKILSLVKPEDHLNAKIVKRFINVSENNDLKCTVYPNNVNVSEIF